MRAAILMAVAVIATPTLAADRYLSGASVALQPILPPPPVAGSPAERADRATFRATRALAGTPRWTQATGDVDEAVPAMLADYSAAAGRTLSVTATPKLAALLLRMRGDVAAAVNAVKPVYARKRPFLIDRGPVCQPRALLAKSYDYPSGHSSWGNAVALVLAELMPAQADAILARGRDYGESRVVCGAHSASAVAAGRIAASAVVARLHGDAAFRADLDAARAELETGR